ncbi:putative pectate lyase A [Peziza echinospora]|nr:putative pectate lyase A [Peziza echinospora]
MKLSFFGIALLGLVELASASPLINKRDSTSEVAPTGYATLNGGTSGGAGGTVTTVTTLAALKSAVSGDSKKIVIVSGTITGNEAVSVGSNTSVLGKNADAALSGVGLRVNGKNNVIIRNLKISKVLAAAGDAIGIQKAKNVWIDHNDLSSDMTHDKDFYDGLLDVTHGSDFITISYNKIHDHFKASLVGHSDDNGSEDKGHLTVTYKHNYFLNLNSRGPSFRFGTGHLFNNYYSNVSDGINTRQGAQLLVQNNVFESSKKPLYSTDGGFAVATGNDFGGAANTATAGTLTSVPYTFSLGQTSTTKAQVVANAGNKLSF